MFTLFKHIYFSTIEIFEPAKYVITIGNTNNLFFRLLLFKTSELNFLNPLPSFFTSDNDYYTHEIHVFIFYINETMKYLSFCAYLTWFNIMSLALPVLLKRRGSPKVSFYFVLLEKSYLYKKKKTFRELLSKSEYIYCFLQKTTTIGVK